MVPLAGVGHAFPFRGEAALIPGDLTAGLLLAELEIARAVRGEGNEEIVHIQHHGGQGFQHVNGLAVPHHLIDIIGLLLAAAVHH